MLRTPLTPSKAQLPMDASSRLAVKPSAANFRGFWQPSTRPGVCSGEYPDARHCHQQQAARGKVTAAGGVLEAGHHSRDRVARIGEEHRRRVGRQEKGPVVCGVAPRRHVDDCAEQRYELLCIVGLAQEVVAARGGPSGSLTVAALVAVREPSGASASGVRCGATAASCRGPRSASASTTARPMARGRSATP